jgi:hypothetical protein
MKYSIAPRRIVLSCLVGSLVVLSLTVSIGMAQDQTEPARGQLKIEGTHIARLLLQRDDGHTEEWSNLSGTIELPVGTYQVKQLSLQDGYTCQAGSLTKLGPIEISADAPTVLRAGGPLQQSIGVNRRGRMLILNYRLHGIGGEEYAPHSGAHAKFTVYRGTTAIAAGAFEYG